MRIEVRHVQVTRTALGNVALTIGDMQREGQYLSYKLFESHRNDSRTLKDIIENMTLCGSCGDGSKRPPTAARLATANRGACQHHGSALSALTE